MAKAFLSLIIPKISYNNLLDINAAVDLIDEFDEVTFAILKHNNACGLASRPTVLEAWKDALAGDPVSAFGGVLVTNADFSSFLTLVEHSATNFRTFRARSVPVAVSNRFAYLKSSSQSCFSSY